MTIVLWDVAQENPIIERYEHHTEFAMGIDFNMFIEGQLASCCKYWNGSSSLFIECDDVLCCVVWCGCVLCGSVVAYFFCEVYLLTDAIFSMG